MNLFANIICLITIILVGCKKTNGSQGLPLPPCNAPLNLSTSLVTTTGAVVNWANNGAVTYELQMKPATSATWLTVVLDGAINSYELKGLQSATVYEWRVKANCASNYSGYSSAQFTTSPEVLQGGGIASQYPGDINIGNDPDVLFVENFDDDLASIINRYDDKLNTGGMSLEQDVPDGSSSHNSLKMTSITGGVTGGGHLYKKFTPGFDSVVFLRYYVKYPLSSKGFFHHEGIWFGGYNPSTVWPNPQAGICGLGDKRLSIAFEPVWQNTNPPGMDTYIYWGDMKKDAGINCWGNVMVTEGATGFGDPSAPGKYPVVTYDQWMCVEIMIRLNKPVTDYNGELAVWVNGVKVGHWGPGFPKGHWDKDKWYNNQADSEFQGFRWRTNENLNINWIWLEYFHENPLAPSSYMKLSNIVMATKYIGPIQQ